jgi:hypothetical protein
VSRDIDAVERVRKAAAVLFAHPSTDTTYLPVHQSTLEQTLKAVAAIGKEFTQQLEIEKAYISLQEDHQILVGENSNAALHARELQAQIDALHQSFSWKVTAPMRRISGIIRGEKDKRQK